MFARFHHPYPLPSFVGHIFYNRAVEIGLIFAGIYLTTSGRTR